MIVAINGYFDRVNRRIPSREMFLIYTIDGAESVKRYGILKKYIKCIQISIFNLLDFIKSKIKARSPVYKFLTVAQVEFDGSIDINFNNGTAVVLNKNDAYKFYFKDTPFFSELYNSIKHLTNMETFSKGNVFVTKQPLYHGVPNTYEDASLLASLDGGLETYRHLLVASLVKKDKYLPQYKILQLMEFLNASVGKEIDIYVDIAKNLGDKSIVFQNGFCHGDLWKENILLNESGKAVLIDFDKAIYFCLSYDYVYFYLMRKVLKKRIRLEEILLNIDHYSSLTHQFFEKNCKEKVSSFSWKEIRLCIYLFLLLKLTEQDFRQNKYGQSIGILQNTLNSI
jgi:hypothetical protein